jgi:DNA-binding transcriptional ArsR family regulator
MVEPRREATQVEIRALAHPVRLRILRLLRFDQLTNAELAAQLELNPASTLHHVRTLVRAGFIEPTRSRPGPNGITEKPYRDTTKSWTLHVSDSKPAARVSHAGIEAFNAEVNTPGVTIETMTRQALKLNRASLDELEARLLALSDEYEQRHDKDGDPYALFVTIHRPARPKRTKRL